MTRYLIQLLYLTVFSVIVISVYYLSIQYSKGVTSSFDYGLYIILLLVVYGIYKIINLILSKGPSRSIGYLELLGYFFMHLLILCIVFFQEYDKGAGFELFVIIIASLLVPIIVFTICIAIGKWALSKLEIFTSQSKTFQVLLSLAVGFFIYVNGLTLLGFVSLLSIGSVLGWMLFLSIISYKQIGELYKDFVQHRFEFPTKKIFTQEAEDLNSIPFYLLFFEFLFIVVTFVIGVDLISIIRPMPIGWDDLGVYMNFPNLIAATGSALHLGGMYPWQIYTSVGYIFGQPMLAFVLNNFGGILAFLVILFGLHDLLKSNKQTFLPIAMLFATLFVSMPMVIFQMAKDMKIDPGLFFISSIVLYAMLYLFMKFIGYDNEIHGENAGEDEHVHIHNDTMETTKNGFLHYFSSHKSLGKDIFLNKGYWILILIIGALAGFTFAIKLTSLLLISGIVGVIAYGFLGVSGFLGYIFVYIGIFTIGDLWPMMNVVVEVSQSTKYTITLLSIFIGMVLWLYAGNKYGIKILQKGMGVLLFFVIGVGIGVTPWAIRNVVSTQSLSISSLLSGSNDSLKIDFLKIYSQDDLDAIEQQKRTTSMTSSGTSVNEDLGRYLGYEKGLNNHIKLPYNLTMQVNQGGEFTDITFIFLALLPLLLFLPYKNNYARIGAWILVLLPLGYFLHDISNYFIKQSPYINQIYELTKHDSFPTIDKLPQSYKLYEIVHQKQFVAGVELVPLDPYFKTGEWFYNLNKSISNIFGKITFPIGYVIIFLCFMGAALYLVYSTNKSKEGQLLKLTMIFGVWYVGLWSVSAFGIVWYGITMYFVFFIVYALALVEVGSFLPEEGDKTKIFKLMGSLVVMLIFITHFVGSTYPWQTYNLINSGYEKYKMGTLDVYNGIFTSQPGYVEILHELNILPEKREDLFQEVISHASHPSIIRNINELKITNIESLQKLFDQMLAQIAQFGDEKNAIEQEIYKIRSYYYKNILYPSEEYKNNTGIYRIGTFLKYFIADNHKRILEDSLIFTFEDYFFDEKNLDKSIERMKTLGLSYFLVDLNAATIDNDSRHALTTRFEHLLQTFTSNKIDLVYTDSVCLNFALERYEKSEKTIEDTNSYMMIAGVNSSSYTPDGKTLSRYDKLNACYNEIFNAMANGEINENNYSFLMGYVQYIQNNLSDPAEIGEFFANYITPGGIALFKIK